MILVVGRQVDGNTKIVLLVPEVRATNPVITTKLENLLIGNIHVDAWLFQPGLKVYGILVIATCKLVRAAATVFAPVPPFAIAHIPVIFVALPEILPVTWVPVWVWVVGAAPILLMVISWGLLAAKWYQFQKILLQFQSLFGRKQALRPYSLIFVNGISFYLRLMSLNIC